MSHQSGISGITANEELRQFFGKCRDGSVRLVKVSIINEQLTLDKCEEPKGTWEEDYDAMVLPLLEEEVPCYILYRFDADGDSSAFQWMLVSWSPDESPVRSKMLYASTKATLKMEFGGGEIKEELFGTVKQEMSMRGYLRYKQNVDAPAPLTFAEEELAELKKNETHVDIGIDTKHQTIQGVAFPLTPDASAALKRLLAKETNYVQLRIDITEEKISLATSTKTTLEKLPGLVPSGNARYHLYIFPHVHEGDFVESIVFIYSMPGYNCSVKERMLYSSCKAPLLDYIESIGITIAKKIEIDSGSELTEEFLQDELHPKQNLHRPKFAKPKGPPNRGAKRITKPTASPE